MSDKSVPSCGGPAFPIPPESDGEYGMSLREYMATEALGAIISNARYVDEIVHSLNNTDSAQEVFRGVAKCALGHADALLAALRGGGK